MRTHAIAALLIAFALLAACVPVPGPASPGPATPAGASTPPQPTGTSNAAEAAARVALATKLNTAAEMVTVVSVERVDWPDACLGAASEGEMCAQVITPGYRIVLEVGGRQYEVHTDRSGKSVRVLNS